MTAHYEDVLADIRARDARDSGARRRAAEAGAATRCCSTPATLDPEQAIAEAIRLVDERLARAEP